MACMSAPSHSEVRIVYRIVFCELNPGYFSNDIHIFPQQVSKSTHELKNCSFKKTEK